MPPKPSNEDRADEDDNLTFCNLNKMTNSVATINLRNGNIVDKSTSRIAKKQEKFWIESTSDIIDDFDLIFPSY